MTFEQIMTLLNKGFTPDQIMSLTNSPNVMQNKPSGNQDPAPTPADPAPATVPTTSPAPAPADPAPAPAPTTTPEQTGTGNADILAALAKLTATIQNQQIAQAMIPGGAMQQKETAEDVLASIINPTYKKE